MTDGFADILIRWYADNHRRLPWRETSDPYLIWLSEVILQQTRVAQGLDYFRRFVARFPDVRSLAEAPQDEVLKLWQGLGYYSRARSLHTAAKDIMARFGGRFPEDYEAVRSLCGVGDYTAAAICSFAYELPYAAVDGNVYRVLSRVYDVDLPVDDAEGKRYFAELAQSLLDLTLGVWSHLVADTVWNTRVNQYLEAHGGKPCEEFRIKKQGDFDWFGKTLGIVSIPRATDRLYTAAAQFGQYSIPQDYVLKTIGVMHEIVRENPGEPDHPPYRLLSEAFFDATFTEVVELTEAGFAARVESPDVPALPLIASC